MDFPKMGLSLFLNWDRQRVLCIRRVQETREQKYRHPISFEMPVKFNKNSNQRPGLMVHVCNPATWVAQAGGL
jgi:hypothetical protein